MTDTTATTNPTDADGGTTTELIDTYLAMWLAADAAERDRLARQVFTPTGRHVDPLADAVGTAGLVGMITTVHAHYPGFLIERTSGIDQHGDQVRFAWTLQAADGTTVVDGLDIGELAADGRLARVTGFWGDLPAK